PPAGAPRGRAVLLLEEGDYHRRGDFSGRASHALRRYYRDQGITVALGNAAAPVWAGRMVGGSTAINSGTCYRTPERTFRYWRERHGLPDDFSAPSLDPYFARVEAMLGVERAERRHTGGVGRVIARGADALGLHEHGPLPRNAPGCDGQGMCCYGCPTGAKRSTDVSYVPAALERGAQLVTAARVDRIDVVAGRARGVVATLGSGRTLRVQASAVVVAAGALMTPLLLRRSGVGGASGWLGRNLSIHPASQVLAEFDEVIDMGNAIPQGYGVESLASEGLMFEGCSTPPDILSLAIPWTGRRLTELLAAYRHLAAFGFMIQDHSRGTVREGPGGSPLITYSQSARDVALGQRGLATLCELFLAAGARRVLPFALGHEEVRTAADVRALRAARLRAGDFAVAGFHPLGTCRLGTDPRRSCVGPDHQFHDTDALYVCDGSVMPSSLGVNPQLTIMALSLRAAEGIDRALG
ncbi:MAG: GMC oxidoreductase, partial [Myxococcales bacterium]